MLVNNAGWDKIEPFVDNDESDWDRILAINLKGPIIVTRALLDAMIERGSGAIVNIASDAGRVGSSGEAVYSAAKGGVIVFTKTLAREMARHGIRANCVCPGPTDTALLATMDDKLRAGLERAIPMRRIAEPGDIAPAVVFLASDAAGYVTGQTLSVSGGLTDGVTGVRARRPECGPGHRAPRPRAAWPCWPATPRRSTARPWRCGWSR